MDSLRLLRVLIESSLKFVTRFYHPAQNRSETWFAVERKKTKQFVSAKQVSTRVNAGWRFQQFMTGILLGDYDKTGRIMNDNGDSKSQSILPLNNVIEIAIKVCSSYLQGSWKNITDKDISVERINGGLSNWIYRVTLIKNNNEPCEVLMRLYGQTYCKGTFENLINESVIFTILSERGLGPKLHGIFPGGRLEEYIPARSLKSKELSDPASSLVIAKKVAELHKLNIPIIKDSVWLWNTIDRLLQQMEHHDWSPENLDLHEPKIISFYEETQWLKKHLIGIGSPVVFCHNDVQGGNILVKDVKCSGNHSLCLIDYEYCAYNYRGFDIANHFIEWTYDYANPVHPYFAVNKDLYPSKEQQTSFLDRYVQCMGIDEPVENILNEVQHFVLASHLFWGIWSAVNSLKSKITFGYKEYAEERIKSYYAIKESLMLNNSNAA